MYLQRVKLPETTFIGDFIVRLNMRGQFEIFEIMVFALTYTKLTLLITNTRFPEHVKEGDLMSANQMPLYISDVTQSNVLIRMYNLTCEKY